MTFQVKSFAALDPKTPLVKHIIERRDIRQDDVEIDILYCGVCHSDLHMAKNDWGFSTYPIVPGHEIVGRVSKVGKDVTKFKVGDLVGVGCMVDSCQHCEPCRHGLEQYCENGRIDTYGAVDPKDGMTTFGGYSEKIVVTEKFVLSVPETLDTKAVAPLLCAGITTWSPLRHWNVGKGTKVAVVGLGGLGHMALKLANALGADVTLFSRSAGKEADAFRLGAHKVVISTDEAQMAQVANTFDVIIDTVPYQHDLKPYINTLTLNGTIVLVGLVGDLEPSISTVPLIMGRRSVAGSLIGGIKETQEMLDFCGEHGITSDVEMIDIQNINQAYERMLKSDVKYRFVIDMQSLKQG
ncbi:NAD(P)-dependent alcohol dehydrogenase [Actinobacillus genomosp. 1]|uniref:NAD(P)-dependent alcohol dehydrogenase n=1 Tax=Actinobacillus TaxID=713 RepID=UPI000E154688|nr:MULTISPECIES: NAD(P)-dependent alcohol dehydrogenase [Actinobacillus]WGE31380.1 NAD(P)-dependent alcohol dehydrogenase [Actinobacillus genomosp. 2]WGE35978.1 NAD(P)-dependent alcohol dehydrogenase [Actinobacillus genomosp. 1]SUU00973.1 alcohol dehydrogenase GroES domain-containing protein [Actinobacillus lignieresii]VEB27593.1 alcohol dehydrogenase GroES domain-containing protein [Actinobacillus lignieresii]